MPFARASELDRLLSCPGPLLLPREELRSEYAKRAADWGTAVHSWKESGEIPRYAHTLRKKVRNSGVDRSALWAYGLHEVPLAYNINTQEARAFVLPRPSAEKNAWKASFGDDWVVGTADYVGVLLDLPWVDDLKTGRGVHYGDYVEQQTFYSLAWGIYNTGGVGPVRSTITHWPRYPVHERPKRFGTVLEVPHFQDFQERLKELRRKTQDLRAKMNQGTNIIPYLSPGAQCTYCPSRSNCSKGQAYLGPLYKGKDFI